ncbi:MAG: tetratricopeptide repeat protein [Desulfosarcina sp.]|nr:tetratricopeptide repeat protein [Desulfobacterales bacterium]
MSQKRISRARKRDLEKPDEFISVTTAFIQKMTQYRTPLIIGIIVVFASLTAFSAVRYFSRQAENRAFQLLSANLQTYQDAARAGSSRQALDQVKPQFESLLADYGNRDGGKLARLVFADLNYQAGNHDDAIANYEQALKVLPEGHFASGSALSGLGYAYVAAGKMDKAVACFEKIVDGNHPRLKTDALYQLGRLYGEQGQPARQKEMYQRLLDEAPEFVYADLIKRELEG